MDEPRHLRLTVATKSPHNLGLMPNANPGPLDPNFLWLDCANCGVTLVGVPTEQPLPDMTFYCGACGTWGAARE